MRPFIHLRTNSEFSISRGLLRVKEIVDAAVKYKMPAIALTDLNNFFGLVKFISYAESKGIKPILGCILNVKDSFSTRVKFDTNTPNNTNIFGDGNQMRTGAIFTRFGDGY